METQPITAETVRERDLILAGRRGDELAMETLFHRYHSLMFQAAFRTLRNTQDAEDSLQDAFVSAYWNLERFEGRSQFATWLTRIVINSALMRRRSIKARLSVSLDDILHEDDLPGVGRFPDPGANPERSTWALKSARSSRRTSTNSHPGCVWPLC